MRYVLVELAYGLTVGLSHADAGATPVADGVRRGRREVEERKDV
jgi:hypothetical protein